MNDPFQLYTVPIDEDMIDYENTSKRRLVSPNNWTDFERWAATRKDKRKQSFLHGVYGRFSVYELNNMYHKLYRKVLRPLHEDTQLVAQCSALWFMDFLHSLRVPVFPSSPKRQRPMADIHFPSSDLPTQDQYKRAKRLVSTWQSTFEGVPTDNAGDDDNDDDPYDPTQCVVCMDKERCIVLGECHHFVLCDACKEGIKKEEVLTGGARSVFPCPICRKDNHWTFNAFFV